MWPIATTANRSRTATEHSAKDEYEDHSDHGQNDDFQWSDANTHWDYTFSG